MIHRESNRLFIGPYAIDAQRNVRAIPYSTMFGRHTGLARHLDDPAGKIVFATMEEGITEVDVKTLAPTMLWADEQLTEGRHADLPGYHGKGFYSAQGRYVYTNNGDHAKKARTNPTVPSGVLAEWDGKADKWTVVRRNQFTDVTGPGGFIKLRPVTTHNRRIHDFASYRGLLVLSGITADAKGEHIVRSEDGKCALWLGTVDDLWSFGKARGTGGPWSDTAVKAGVASDPYLATGYDQKRLTLSHTGTTPVKFRVEADFTGDGTWTNAATLTVAPGKPLEYPFPAAFGAYWLRLVADQDTTATATFIYE